jgi:putative DNA primase/helicase
MDLSMLRAALGGEISGNQLLCPGPGHNKNDRSLSVRLSPQAPDGFLTHSFAGDNWQECRDYIKGRLGLAGWEPGDERDRRVPAERVIENTLRALKREESEPRELDEDQRRRAAHAAALWNTGIDPRGTLAETYLSKYRLLNLPDPLAGTVLRFHPLCPWRNENIGFTIHVPALLAAFTSVDDDEVSAVHRIALNADGSKQDRRMLGVVHRAAVKLDPIGEALAIGEGVETCMAAREMGITPAWALGSVGAISKFPILDGVQTLVIIGEAGKASRDAVEICKTRWTGARRIVRIVMPDEPHSDLNDELIYTKRKFAA